MANIDNNQLVEFSDDDVEDSFARTGASLVGRYFSERLPTQLMQRIVSGLWINNGPKRIVSVQETEMGLLQFVFSDADDKNRILGKTPWIIRNRILHLQEWEPTSQEYVDSFVHVPFWIHLRCIPPECRSTKLGRKLAFRLGDCIKAGLFGVSGDEGYLVKVLVKIDIGIPLRTRLMANNATFGAFEIELAYERLPEFCYNCGRIGHEKKACQFPYHNRSEVYDDQLVAKESGVPLDEKTLLPIRGAAPRLSAASLPPAKTNNHSGISRVLPTTVPKATNAKGKGKLVDCVEPDPTEFISQKLSGVVISETPNLKSRSRGRIWGNRPKPGFKMSIGELEEMLTERKRLAGEMMSDPDPNSACPKRPCPDSEDLLDKELAELPSVNLLLQSTKPGAEEEPRDTNTTLKSNPCMVQEEILSSNPKEHIPNGCNNDTTIIETRLDLIMGQTNNLQLQSNQPLITAKFKPLNRCAGGEAKENPKHAEKRNKEKDEKDASMVNSEAANLTFVGQKAAAPAAGTGLMTTDVSKTGQKKLEGNNMLLSRKQPIKQSIDPGKLETANGAMPVDLKRVTVDQNSTILPGAEKPNHKSMQAASGRMKDSLIFDQHGSFLTTAGSENLMEKIQTVAQSCWNSTNQQGPHSHGSNSGPANVTAASERASDVEIKKLQGSLVKEKANLMVEEASLEWPQPPK